MALHAVQNIDDAFVATREFLLPFDLRRWVKLALVAIFIGSGVNVPSTSVNTSAPSGQAPEQGASVALPENALLIVGIVVALFVLFVLVWTLISAILEFVFVESLRNGDVLLRQYWGERWRQGMRLFAFRIAIGLPMLALLAGWLVFFFAPVLLGVGQLVLPIVALVFGIPLFVILGLLFGLISGFTTVFVVPIMVLDDCGVLAGWRQLWASIVGEWKQYLAYAVVSVVLSFALGILSSIVLGITAVIVLLPLAVVGVLVHFALSLSSTAGLVALALLVLVFAVSMFIAGAFVQVPILTYLRYYALLVLGDIDASFDLIPDRRRAIRSDE